MGKNFSLCDTVSRETPLGAHSFRGLAMSSWLDTETKALLQKSPPDKLAPPDTAGFTLVVLSIYGHNNTHVVRAIKRILGTSEDAASRLLTRPLPFAVKAGLSYADASLGQFELISSDAISVLLNDEVFNEGAQEYLDQLYATLLQSSEFEIVAVRIQSIPSTDRGGEFIDQFLGNDDSWRSAELKLPRKKARIMEHWAKKIGGLVTWSDI